MVEKELTERVIWERGANMKRGPIKVPGTLVVTTKKLSFKPFLSKSSLIIWLKDIQSVESTKGIRPKVKLHVDYKEYIFSIKDAQHVSTLICTLLR